MRANLRVFKKLPVLFVAVALFSFFGNALVTYAAFGVSPPFFNANHLVPGVTYAQTIYLVQDQPTVDLPILVTLNVPDHVKSWITIDKGLSFTIPVGVQQFPVQVSVTVPNGEGLGAYPGNMVFATNPAQAGQVTIALGANVSINLTVGTGTFEQYSIPYITIPSIEEGWNPRVTYKFQNQGNVSEQMDSAAFTIYDQYDSVQLAYLTKQDGFPEVPPFTTKEYTIEFPTNLHLGVGSYWGAVTFYKNNQPIGSQKMPFNVLPPGSLSSPLDLAWENITEYWIYYLVGIIVLLLIGRRILMMRRGKKNLRS